MTRWLTIAALSLGVLGFTSVSHSELSARGQAEARLHRQEHRQLQPTSTRSSRDSRRRPRRNGFDAETVSPSTADETSQLPLVKDQIQAAASQPSPSRRTRRTRLHRVFKQRAAARRSRS